MREIILDTETTGFEPGEGHRLVEIGCIELVNRFPTGNIYHVHINPERDVPADAFRVHGLSTEFLRDKPLFSALALEFLEFIGDASLVIHNASFDVKFLNFELQKIGLPKLAPERIIDTLQLARRKHPGASNSLDALCDRYGIDRSRRVKHGALLDAEFLAEVYSELLGGKQTRMDLNAANTQSSAVQAVHLARTVELSPLLTDDERQAHEKFIAELGPKTIWSRFIEPAKKPAN